MLVASAAASSIAVGVGAVEVFPDGDVDGAVDVLPVIELAIRAHSVVVLEREPERIDGVVAPGADRVADVDVVALARGDGRIGRGRDHLDVERRRRVEPHARHALRDGDAAKDRMALVRQRIAREERRLVQDADAIREHASIPRASVGPLPAVR